MGTEMNLPASYYGELDERNPVIVALQKEMNVFLSLMKRAASSPTQDNSCYVKGIKILSEVQSKYRNRLPPKVFEENMLRIADYLFGIKLYQLALWQGYSLHLKCYSPVNVADITDVKQFMDCFFPQGFDTHQDIMSLKFRALQGYFLCMFELEKRCGVLSQEGLGRLLRVLDLLRITMQAFQPHEHLCWQLYNGSLNIYNICRYLMTMSCSAQALEYLLWASCSLEMSVPLMTARYVPWRATLYSAVCRCYYDNQAATQAQVFAKRALGKISDLAGLEEQTGTLLTSETKRAYKEATIKMATMVFKRAVFEARRRPKSLFRGRQKSNLKDIPCVPWPRTATQHMLTEMFDCSTAQFLAVLEALWDSGRRPLQTGVPEEADLHEVVLEILASGISILSGGSGGGNERGSDDSLPTCFSALTPTGSLMEFAVSGGNRVPYLSAVRFIKLLFHYEQWESFTALARQLQQVLASAEGPFFKKAELELTLLDTFESLQASQRTRLREDTMSSGKDKKRSPVSDEFICLVDTLHKSVCSTAKGVQPDSNLVVDMVLFLWSKMKGVFQREQHPGKLEVCHEWIWCLSTLCEVSFTCNLATVDHVAMAEMTLKLAMLLESAADCNTHTPSTANKEDDVDPSTSSLLKKSSEDLLQTVCEVVERADEALGRAWSRLLPRDGSAIADPTFIQKCQPLTASVPPPTASPEEGNGVENRKGETGDGVEEKQAAAESEAKSPNRTVSTPLFLVALDLHLELLNIYHRASLKLLQISPVLTETELLDGIGKNKASKVLFLIQNALLLHDNMDPNSCFKPKRLLEEALGLLEKAGSEERKLYCCRPSTNKPPSSTYENKDRRKREARDKPPPCPVLLFRDGRSMTFAPAPYLPKVQVCWYQICTRVAEGASVKVRLGDCSLQGTGDMVPVVSGGCELRVEGLQPNQKYVFAVSAYDSQGELVGGGIGETTPPILASLPLPLLSIWAHLAQAAFKAEQYDVAKKACQGLWNHYTHHAKPCSHYTQDNLALTGLCARTLQHSSPVLLRLFLASVFVETEINVQRGALYCDSVGGLHIWAQEARLAECERMLVAVDLAMWLGDSAAALQAVVSCYGLLAPLIFHQITSDQIVQVLVKCLVVLEENSAVLKLKWTRNTSESLMHMIACITYYLSKAFRVLGELRLAPLVLERGCTLLQEVYEAQLIHCRVTEETEGPRRARERWRGKSKKVLAAKQFSVQMKALRRKIKNGATGRTHDLTGQEDPSINYNLIANSPLKSAYGDVMKLRNETCFVELAALLLQRAREEDQPDEIIAWGEDILISLCRLDERLSVRHLDGKGHNKSRTNETSKNKKSSPVKDRRKKQLNMLQDSTTDRDLQAVDTMLAVVRSHQQSMQLRHIRSEERVWRSQLNHTIAQAHIVLLHRGLKQLYGPALEQSYNHLDPLAFSLAQSRVLVRRKNALQLSEPDVISQTRRVSPLREGFRSSPRDAHESKEKDKAVSGEDSNSADSEKGEDVSQCKEPDPPTTTLLLESLSRAALHLRRAMMLAHRGGHWTLLRCVCWTAWEQGRRLLETGAQALGTERLHTALTPLLVLATDLLMDMLERLGLWSVYGCEASDEELETSLHFSPLMDDGTQVDLRWVRTLVLYTLEQLHLSGKWETLAHFAILFNSHTRERYTLMVTPLLVHAQRRLLDRIASFEGPPVPQPHHVKTQRAAGHEITIRNYAGCQLLSGWVRPTKASLTLNNQPEETTPAHNNPQKTSSLCLDTLKLQEVQHSMALVRVPLDVEDTLRCHRQSVDKRPHSLCTFHHSHTLLLLLLAHTQRSLEVPVCQGVTDHSSGQVHFSPTVTSAPSHQPPNPAEEDYSTDLYSAPVSPNHIHTVIRAYSTSIKYLHTNGHSSLTVQALHDLGNLHFYNGNTRAAHAHWRKAVDYALHCTGVLEKWDGLSWGGGSLQDTLKLAGIWGCMQAAVLTAKIAQYMVTSDINQRTMTCLLSAHLFKCVLCCSLPQAQCDLWYASHGVGDELLPGVDLFSEPHRAHPATAVTSLSFLCHWLCTAGHYVVLLPMLALYLYFVGTVCRDPQRTVEGKILKVHALTELSLFSPAIKEAGELIQGKGILLPHGCNVHVDESQPMRKFYSNKSLLDNNQALEDLVNRGPAPEVQKLYGSMLCRRLILARAQLVLALSSTIHSLPSAGCSDGPLPREQRSDVKTEDPKGLGLDRQKDKLTPERVKFLLLEGAFHLLTSSPQQQVPQTHSKAEELELNIEANLLMAKLYLMQGRAALSADMAVLSLVLLQTSPVIVQRSSSDEETNVLTPGEDSPRAVEARERMGTALWLQCRLALLRSLVAHIPGTAIFPGKDSHMEAMRVLEDSLEECASWRDPDTQALLLLEGASLHIYRAQAANRMSGLQEAVGLLSGRTRMPPGSSVTLARATMRLSDLRGTDSTKLLELTQKLLQQQLCVFGQRVELDGGRVCFPPPGPSNIYLPHLSLLAKTTLRIGHILALRAMKRPISAHAPESAPGQGPSQTESTSQDTDSTQTSMSSPFQGPRVVPSAAEVRAWHHAHRVLQSALVLSRSCAYRDIQLDTHLLYCCGSVERSLRYLSHVKRQEVAETFLECIQTSTRHCPHLPMLRECYMEIALLFFHDWQHGPHKTPAPLSQKELSSWKRLVAILNRGLTETEGCLMLFWICLRGAAMAWKAMCGCGKLCGSIGTSGGVLSKTSLEALPDFAINDLLNSCGGIHLLAQVSTNSSHPEVEHSFRIASRGSSQLTWAHVARYYTHLLNLQQMATKPACPRSVKGLGSLAGEVSLALRLSQLQNFFRSHMPDYTETCFPPQPAPTDIVLSPQIVQLSPSVRASLGQADEVYQWSVSPKQQLCMQWHQPSLTPVSGHNDMVFLLYGHNRHPMSAMRGSASVIMGLECGRRMIKVERVRVIHAELCELCASANMVLSAAASFSRSPDPEDLQPNTTPEKPLSPPMEASTSPEKALSPHMQSNTTPEKPLSPHMQMLKEKILICCLSIKGLLQPGSKVELLPEVPFDITLENLYDLERCFNPEGGAIVEGSALTEWLLSVLTCS